jgi:hypothetical protein
MIYHDVVSGLSEGTGWDTSISLLDPDYILEALQGIQGTSEETGCVV